MLFLETKSIVKTIRTIIIIKKNVFITLFIVLDFLWKIVYKNIMFVINIIIAYVAKFGKNICLKMLLIRLSNIFDM